MVGIFGSGSYFICRWKRPCSGRGCVGGGGQLDSRASVLQSRPRCVLTRAAAKAQSGSETLPRWGVLGSSLLGSGLSKQKPAQTSLFVEPPSLFISFRSGSSLGCGTLEWWLSLPQAGCVPPLPKRTCHASVSLYMAQPCRGDGERELGHFTWLCHWPESWTWKHATLVFALIRWV